MRSSKLLTLRLLHASIAPLARLERIRAGGSTEQAAWGWICMLAAGVAMLATGSFLDLHADLFREMGGCFPSPTQTVFDNAGVLRIVAALIGACGTVAALTRRGPLVLLRGAAALSLVLAGVILWAAGLPFEELCCSGLK